RGRRPPPRYRWPHARRRADPQTCWWRLGAPPRAAPSRYGPTVPGPIGGSVTGGAVTGEVTRVVTGGDVGGGSVGVVCATPSVVGVLSLLEPLLLLPLLCDRRRFVELDPESELEPELEPELPDPSSPPVATVTEIGWARSACCVRWKRAS